MTAINRATLQQIRKELNTVLAPLAVKHGLVFNMGNIRFDANGFRGKLTATSTNGAASGAVVVDAKAAALQNMSWQLGNTFNKDNIYSSMLLGRFKVVGYNRSAHKYPFIVQVEKNGKRFKVTGLTVQNAVNAGAVILSR